MSQILGRRAILTLIVASALLLLSCNSAASSPEIATPSPLPVQLFVTSTATSPVPSTPSEATQPPQASPTPFTYAILEGETLLGIAERNGITLDELLVANPGVDARFLSIGQEILIPSIGGATSENSQPNDLPDLGLGTVRCLASASSELWCFVPVSNNTDSPVENTLATVNLFSPDGEPLAEAQASGLIQKLDSGAAMPLVAYWPQVPAGWASASATLTSAFRLDDPATRYTEITVDSLSVQIAASALSTKLSGQIVSNELATIAELRLLAIVYDAQGQPAGLRRITLEAGQSDFEFEVYSLGPAIDRVEVLAEARR